MGFVTRTVRHLLTPRAVRRAARTRQSVVPHRVRSAVFKRRR
jgi:hypothetical protein